MNDICGINRIAPFQGFHIRDDSFRRALPYAIDLWAFSPMYNYTNRNGLFRRVLSFAIDLWAFSPMSTNKAESLAINSIGQRPMKRNTHVNPKPRRGAINLIISH